MLKGDPMMAGVSSGRIESLNGIQLYSEIHGSGEPLLLLRGFIGSSLDWAVLRQEWQAFIVPDMRGHGRSPIRRQYSGTMKPLSTFWRCSTGWELRVSRESE